MTDSKTACSINTASPEKEQSALVKASANNPVRVEHRKEDPEFDRVVPIADEQKRHHQFRRYQLHLWISEKEYTMLKQAAELHDEPMSRIVRRLFSQLKYLNERKVG